jgi:hypothetical protein
LLQEAAPLVCHANLHVAVARTNQFAFAQAREALQRWADIPPEAPGLLMWAQVKSSLGQHAAFLGETRLATGLFKEAIHGFERLSDPQQRAKDIAQTSCYLAIAMMDDPEVSDAEAREAVEKVAGSVAHAARSLSESDDNANRYAHHLFLRWLVRRGDPALAGVYCERRSLWKTGEGHPWPLIQLYRAILLKQAYPLEARGLAVEAAQMATEARQGPVVRLIGACCRALAVAWGEDGSSLWAEVQALRLALPLATAQLEALEEWIQNPGPHLPMLERVLPFNFH